MSNITHGLDGEVVIGIDCPPASPRPNIYIEQVVKHLGITEIDKPDSMTFGAWTWRFKGISESKWMQCKDAVIKECQELYNSGRIRGAQHYWDSALESYINSKITIDTILLKHLSIEDILGLVSTSEEKDKFVEDFEYAKGFVDQMFKTYEERLTPKQ